MKNLRDQNCCWNCKHVYCLSQQDEDTKWYCDIKKYRPKATHEIDWKEIRKRYEKAKEEEKKDEIIKIEKEMDMWPEWINKHEVMPYQICDGWNE